jgi:sigma-B regulation protein RsbU (phosphoserine phosphatase)
MDIKATSIALKGNIRKLIETQRISVLLVDDQPIIGEALRKMLASEADIDFLHIQDPTQVIPQIDTFNPTVILLDLVMPQVEGLTLLRYLRANQASKDIPIVVLSSKEEASVKAHAFFIGANDYMVKLPAKEEVLARVRYHSKGYISLLQRNLAYQALEANQKLLKEELDKAADYVESTLPAPLTEGPIRSSWIFIPSVELGGDSFGYHWLDDDHFAIYLLDVCGHGVGAALLSVSVMNVLRAQSLPKCNFQLPEQVLAGLNNTFPMEKHNNMFFTMFYAVYNRTTRTLSYASGGHPPSLLFQKPSQGAVEELDAPGLVVGGMPDMIYEGKQVRIEAGAKLYVFSDGVFELTRPDGKGGVMRFAEFVEMLRSFAQGPEQKLEVLVERARTYQADPLFEDDYSIIEFCF